MKLLGVVSESIAFEPPDKLAPRLREHLARGVIRQGAVLTWADSTANAHAAPSFFPDLTGWECADSSFHIEDFIHQIRNGESRNRPNLDAYLLERLIIIDFAPSTSGDHPRE